MLLSLALRLNQVRFQVDTQSSRAMIKIAVPASMSAAIGGAVVRLNGLYPEFEFLALTDGVDVEVCEPYDKNKIKSEVFNAIYREAILLRTNDIRTKIIG